MRFALELEKGTISRSGESSTDGGGKDAWDPKRATGIECRLNPEVPARIQRTRSTISSANERLPATTMGSQSLDRISRPVRKETKQPPVSRRIARGAAMSHGACLTLSSLLSWTIADNPVVPSSNRMAPPEWGGKEVTNLAPSRVRSLLRR